MNVWMSQYSVDSHIFQQSSNFQALFSFGCKSDFEPDLRFYNRSQKFKHQHSLMYSIWKESIYSRALTEFFLFLIFVFGFLILNIKIINYNRIWGARYNEYIAYNPARRQDPLYRESYKDICMPYT